MRCWHTKIAELAPKQYKHEIPIAAPASGELLSLVDTNNPVTALRMFGEGVALRLTGQQIFSPVSGNIIEFPSTCQCIRIKAKNGVDLRLNFIDDMSRFMAEKFFHDVKVGQSIAKGDSLFRFDLNQIKAEYSEALISITIINAAQTLCIVPNKYGRKVMASIDNVMSIYVA